MIYLNIRAWKGDKKDFNSDESTTSAASQSLSILFSARKGFFFIFYLASYLRKVLLIPILILYLVDRHYINRCMGQGATTWF